jgi:hypothetical protein
MISRIFLSAATLAALAFVTAGPGSALTSKECSTKYQAAKSAGTLNGKSWNDFRKTECAGTEAAPEAKADAKVGTTTVGGAVFPKSIDPKYAKESGGKARMHTCLDQYKANKANNGNGGMKWIQKGGGYYSKCNAALKS